MNNQRLLKSLTPYLFILKLFGCFPFQKNRNDSIKISSINVIYGFVLVATCNVYTIIFSSEINSKSVIDVLMEANSLLETAATTICFLANLYNLQTIKEIFENVLSHEKYLKNSKFYDKIFWVTLGNVVGNFLTNAGLVVVYYLLHEDDDFIIYILDGFVVCYSYFVIASFMHQYCYLLIYFTKIIDVLNEELGKLTEKTNVWIENLDLVVIKENKNIMKLVEVYVKICYLFEDINNSFGVATAMTLIISFLGFLESVFQYKVDGQFILFALRFGYLAFLVWFLLYSCESALNEVRKYL